ncbi:MAG: RHS repeat protein, partial [Phycisphaerae bacterium]
MSLHRHDWYGHVVALAMLALFVPAGLGQIRDLNGDGVLNAPYRGTITSLREATMDLPFGEVMSQTEPRTSSGTGVTIDTSVDFEVWLEAPDGTFEQSWDRSVLRLYRGMDASGSEIDLTGHDTNNRYIVPPASVQRFTFKAIGTKTLARLKYGIRFRYRPTGLGTITQTNNITVAPMTGSFLSLPGESEAFHFGTPILDVAVGNARLTVPVGQTAAMIGAAYQRYEFRQAPGPFTCVSNVVFPGAAESVYIQHEDQFRLGGNFGKAAYGTPWAGYRVGFFAIANNVNDWWRDVTGPDGTIYDSNDSASTAGVSTRKVHYIRPHRHGRTHFATQRYTYSGNNVTQISDGNANTITLTRDAGTGRVTYISTSDGRGWTILTDPLDPAGWITGVVPDGGKGARYYSHDSTTGRVTEVRLDPTPGVGVLYQFEYYADGDLWKEKRHIDGAAGNPVVAVLHERDGEGHRIRKEYVDEGNYRQLDLYYDTAANLNHRLARIVSHGGLNGSGPTYTTTYHHDVDNARGNMVITGVDLPDGTTLHHEYNAQHNPQVGSPPSVDVGFRTRTTHTGPSGSLVTLDREYEFFYPSGGLTYLFYHPRVVKSRDGRGALSEVTYDYENGGTDENNDGLQGQHTNQLLKQTGPAITAGYSGTRTPERRYFYHDNTTDSTRIGTLRRQETDYASGQFRVIEFAYDALLRLTSQTVDPGGENIVTQYQYVDNLPTQDRITIDPDNYFTRTRFDNDGRVATEERFLNAGVTTGPVYTTTHAYDTAGRLQTRTIENKDQDGNPLSPATLVTQFSYDRLGRLLLRTVDPGGIGQESHFAYNWLGDVVREFDTTGRGVARTYEGRGLVATETPLALNQTPDANLTTTFTYDALGNMRFLDRPTGTRLERVYDDFARLQQEIRHPISGLIYGPITTTFEYDAAHHVTRTYVRQDSIFLSDTTALFDEGGFNYETRARLVAGVDGASDLVTRRKFDWAGNVVEEKSLGDATVNDGVNIDRVITTHYDGASRVDYVTDSEGGRTDFVRDDRGNVTQQTVRIDGGNSGVTNTVYDALSRAIQITDPENSTGGRPDRIRRYDSRGNLLRETVRDPADNPVLTTVFSYDNAGRQTRQAVLADPAGFANPVNVTVDRVTDSGYDADGRLLTRTTYNNNSATPLTTVTTYDSLGRVDTVTDPSGSFTDEDYTANGRLSQRTVNDGLGSRVFTFTYDDHDRIETQTAVGAPDLVTTFLYDGLDRQIYVIDPKGIFTRTDYDLAGRRIALVENEGGGALERVTQFGFNRLSQLITQTAQNKTSTGAPLPDQVTTFRYDTLGRQRRAIYPDSTNVNPPETCTDCVRSEYDAAGRMTTRTDQRDLTTVYTYDDRGLPLTRTTGTTLDTWDYDAVGRPVLADRGTTGNPTATSHTVFAYTGSGDLDYETQTLAGGTPRTIDY